MKRHLWVGIVLILALVGCDKGGNTAHTDEHAGEEAGHKEPVAGQKEADAAHAEDIVLSPEILTKLFDEVFGTDRKALDYEWRDYMGTLKTDIEKILKDR